MKRITRVRTTAVASAPAKVESRETPTPPPAPAKARIIAGRVPRTRTRFGNYERSTEALDHRRPKPYFLMDWRRPLSWKYSIFLINSYLYYLLGGRAIISDSDYDRLAKELLVGYDLFSHPHKYLCTKAMLAAGTAYNISKYPSMVVGAATHALEAFREV